MKLPPNTAENSSLSSEEIISSLHKKLAEKDKQLAEKNIELKLLYEKFRLEMARRYGPRSEQLSEDERKQLSLFDEDGDINQSEQEAIEEDEAEITVPAHTRKKKVGKKSFPDHLPRIDVVHDLAEEEKVCHCGECLKSIGEAVTEQLDIIPMQLKVIRHIEKKYACSKFEEHGVVQAKKPSSILGKSRGTAKGVAHVAVMKYQHHLPLYRQEQMFKQLDIQLPRKTLCHWLIKASQGLESFFDIFQQHLLQCNYLQADETPMKMLKPPEPGKNIKQGYTWVYRGKIKGHTIALVQAKWSRASTHLLTQLKDFEGVIQSDGYIAYDLLEKANQNIHLVSCLAHIRRKFYELVQLQKKSKQKNKVGKAQQALSMIEKLYKADHLAAKQLLNSDQRLALRTEYKLEENLKALQAWCEKSINQVPPKSGIGKAIAYAIRFLPKLKLCITRGDIELDNNLAENLVRPIALGRKNFLFLGAESGMIAASTFYSLIQTCKANEMNAFEYLSYLLTTITRHSSIEQLNKLMPFHSEMVEKFQLKKSN